MAYIFVGGFGDGVTGSRIVVNYYNTFAQRHPGCQYFDWDERKAIEKALDALGKDEPINLIGHSYGGDTLGNIAANYKRTINTLVTIDPVGHTPISILKLIKGNCTMWVDVNAVPSAWFNFSNFVAAAGGYWGDDPKGIATVYIEADFNHENFPRLMTAPDNYGQTAAMILDRGGVGAAN